MIIAFEGTPGSGKTYDAVRKIADNLRKHRCVITNIDGMADPLCKRALQDITGLDDLEFSELFHCIENNDVSHFWDLEICKPGSLIVIDEAHKFFNSRMWQKEENQAFSDWCSTHRHFGYDVILISQKLTKIDKQAVSNIEWTYRYRKINFLGSLVKKGYTVKSYSGDDTTDPVSNQVRYYDVKIFKAYQSYISKDIKEMGVQKNVNLLKHPVFILIPIVVVFTIFMFTRSGLSKGDLFGANAVMDRVSKHRNEKSLPPEPKNIKSSPSISDIVTGTKPAAGTSVTAAVAVPSVPIQKSHVLPVSSLDEKRLVAVIGKKKIYKCGARFCED